LLTLAFQGAARSVCRKSATLALMWLACAAGAAAGGKLPEPLVYLRDADPTIEQDMRYATTNNFTGSIVPGYDAPECVLTQEVAKALSMVQADMRSDGISLKVYDCYRPERAVKFFLNWVAQPVRPEHGAYYPRINRKGLVALGYVAAKSNHSRGIAVDLSLIDRRQRDLPKVGQGKSVGACNAPDRAMDNSVDMGTNFDCFDPMSAASSASVNAEQRNWRERLRFAMERRGFRSYEEEWWHFTFASPVNARSFDVPIRVRPAG